MRDDDDGDDDDENDVDLVKGKYDIVNHVTLRGVNQDVWLLRHGCHRA